jgi:hypothetical protein
VGRRADFFFACGGLPRFPIVDDFAATNKRRQRSPELEDFMLRADTPSRRRTAASLPVFLLLHYGNVRERLSVFIFAVFVNVQVRMTCGEPIRVSNYFIVSLAEKNMPIESNLVVRKPGRR